MRLFYRTHEYNIEKEKPNTNVLSTISTNKLVKENLTEFTELNTEGEHLNDLDKKLSDGLDEKENLMNDSKSIIKDKDKQSKDNYSETIQTELEDASACRQDVTNSNITNESYSLHIKESPDKANNSSKHSNSQSQLSTSNANISNNQQASENHLTITAMVASINVAKDFKVTASITLPTTRIAENKIIESIDDHTNRCILNKSNDKLNKSNEVFSEHSDKENENEDKNLIKSLQSMETSRNEISAERNDICNREGASQQVNSIQMHDLANNLIHSSEKLQGSNAQQVNSQAQTNKIAAKTKTSSKVIQPKKIAKKEVTKSSPVPLLPAPSDKNDLSLNVSTNSKIKSSDEVVESATVKRKKSYSRKSDIANVSGKGNNAKRAKLAKNQIKNEIDLQSPLNLVTKTHIPIDPHLTNNTTIQTTNQNMNIQSLHHSTTNSDVYSASINSHSNVQRQNLMNQLPFANKINGLQTTIHQPQSHTQSQHHQSQVGSQFSSQTLPIIPNNNFQLMPMSVMNHFLCAAAAAASNTNKQDIYSWNKMYEQNINCSTTNVSNGINSISGHSSTPNSNSSISNSAYLNEYKNQQTQNQSQSMSNFLLGQKYSSSLFEYIQSKTQSLQNQSLLNYPIAQHAVVAAAYQNFQQIHQQTQQHTNPISNFKEIDEFKKPLASFASFFHDAYQLNAASKLNNERQQHAVSPAAGFSSMNAAAVAAAAAAASASQFTSNTIHSTFSNECSNASTTSSLDSLKETQLKISESCNLVNEAN
jgi:hypothetical protein